MYVEKKCATPQTHTPVQLLRTDTSYRYQTRTTTSRDFRGRDSKPSMNISYTRSSGTSSVFGSFPVVFVNAFKSVSVASSRDNRIRGSSQQLFQSITDDRRSPTPGKRAIVHLPPHVMPAEQKHELSLAAGHAVGSPTPIHHTRASGARRSATGPGRRERVTETEDGVES